MKYIYTITILFFLSISFCFATHLKGGEIRASYISGQTYKISVLLYMDIVNGSGAVEAQNTISTCMGDGNVITIPRISSTQVIGSAGVVAALYEANYTYPSSGTYQISVSENNRNNSLNFPNAISSNLFLWTVLNTQLPNSTPILPYLNFNAGVKQVFSIDLKSTGTDSDSTSFRLQKLSKPSPGTCGVRSIDQTYIYPNDVTKTGTFKINQAEKKLVWTAPEQVGNYLYAMVVDEWRDGTKISETYREGLITVTDQPGSIVNIPPYDYAENSGGLITSTPKLDSPEVTIAVEAYPVPTEDFVTVKAYSKKPAIIKLQLIDLQGRILSEVKSKTLGIVIQEQFDLRRYSKGIYIIRAQNDTESVSQKILR